MCPERVFTVVLTIHSNAMHTEQLHLRRLWTRLYRLPIVFGVDDGGAILSESDCHVVPHPVQTAAVV